MANAITKQQLEELKLTALNYKDFLAGAEDEHKEKYIASYHRYNLTPSVLEKFNAMEHAYDVLILTAHNCGDSMTNLPLVAKLAHDTQKFNLYILLREEHTELHQQYLHKDGKPHIPTYIFFDKTGKELGVFIERPDKVSELSDQWANEFWDAHPELEGRGVPLSELDLELKRTVIAHLRSLRPTAYQLEQDEIINIITAIIN